MYRTEDYSCNPSRSIELVLLLQNAAQFVSRSDLTARKEKKKIRNRTSPDTVAGNETSISRASVR